MDPMKLKLIDELMSHLSGMQASDLKGLVDQAKMAKEGSPMEEMSESPADEMAEDSGKPKGLSVEKVSVMGKPQSFDDKAKDAINGMSDKGDESEDPMKAPGEEEMSEDELK